MKTAASTSSALMALHGAVVLFGLAGLFAKALPLSAMAIVLGRTFFATLALALFWGLRSRRRAFPSGRQAWIMVALGVVLALHWWTFFHAIKVSSVAVGLLGYAAFPLFVTLIEPLLFREAFRWFDLLIACAIAVGLAAVAWPFDLNSGRVQGVLWGMLSGFLFAALSLLNRRSVRSQDPAAMACLQNGGAFLTLVPLGAFWESWSLTAHDLGLLLLLGIVCTAVAHALFIFSLTAVRAQLAGVVAALEPVYGIVFAFFLIGEVPSPTTLIGGAVIVGTTIVAIQRRQPTGEPAHEI